MTNNKKYHIFISYSRDNKNYKNKLVKDLRDYGFDVWVDDDSITLANNWTDEIKKGISNSQILLYLASPESIDSTYISYELGYADALNKIILPIRIKGHTWAECMPSWYSVTQGMELRGSQYDKRKIKLFESIVKILSQSVKDRLVVKGLARDTAKLGLILKAIHEWEWDEHFEKIEFALIDAGTTQSINRNKLGEILQILTDWKLINTRRFLQESRIESQTSEYIEIKSNQIGLKIADNNL